MGSQCHIDSGMKDMLYTKPLGLVVTPSIRTYSPYISKKQFVPLQTALNFRLLNFAHFSCWLWIQSSNGLKRCSYVETVEWSSVNRRRDNQKIIDKENPKIPKIPNLVKRVSSKETKPLNYEHRTRHNVEWPLGFASSTILKNAKYDSLKGLRGTKSRRFSELINFFPIWPT